MNTIRIIILAVLLFSASLAVSQSKKDSLGLPGDNFDLYGALELFKKAENPEAFEKAINSSDNEVNNLDLDADGKVDYVKVVDKTSGDAHSLVLQVAVSKTETQDVAVIEIEKKGDKKAHLQIVGDEELYGKDYIVEPRETASAASSRSSDKNNEAVDDVYNDGENIADENSRNNYNGNGGGPVIVNVWGWPSVSYIYGPAYVGWVSPWYWSYYPVWWQPWPPVYWGVYYRRVYRYHYPYYYRTGYYRCRTAHNYYYGQRVASETVRQNNRSGLYRQRQASYRNNVRPGRRYNSLPANPRNNMGRPRSGERNAVRQRNGSNRPTEQRQVSPRQGSRGAVQQDRRQDIQPNRQHGAGRQREQMNPSQQQAQPRQQVNPQPRQQQMQPRQQPVQPRQQMGSPRMGGAPQGGHQGGNRRGG
jgi:hypothetical protein